MNILFPTDKPRGVQESCGEDDSAAESLGASPPNGRFVYGPDFAPEIPFLMNGAQSHVLSGNYGDGNREVKSKDSSSNGDYGANNEELIDNLLAAPEQRTAEDASSVDSHVLRSREDRVVREEQETEREQQAESERGGEMERQEAETRPPRQGGVSAESLWLCEHYQRRCSVQFPCCTQFYPCHRCHNSSANCEEAKASVDATHFKCSVCQFEQEVSFCFLSLKVHVTVLGSLGKTKASAAKLNALNKSYDWLNQANCNLVTPAECIISFYAVHQTTS